MKIILSAFVIFLIFHRYQLAIVNGYGLTHADSVAACSHNGTRFANGSFVPTLEPCLNCKCINTNLICALRVCPEQPIPPPRGCIVVQKRESCCPYLTCSKFHAANKGNDDKKVVTYDRKWYEQNIRNRIFSQNTLLRKIEADDDNVGDDRSHQSTSGNEKMCIHNGTVYRSGSAMTTSSLCLYCYCIAGKQKCIKPKCILPAKGCEPILIDTSCCPIRYDCTGNGTIKARYQAKQNRARIENQHFLRMTSRMQRSRGCLVDSTFYPEGHKLPANQTYPCEICFCIGGSKRCTPKRCAPLIKNCRPIIPEGQCCPSSYDCDDKPQIPMARGFTPRQYDFFSLLFGDEEKENSTAHWEDHEGSGMETISINHGVEASSEKGLLDAIRESLNYIDASKTPNDHGANVSTEVITPIGNSSDIVVSDDDDDEISLLDFFLNAEKKFSSSTTQKAILLEQATDQIGLTNSPMHIKPILPDEMKNESIRFALLPMSLYNMVKDDGSIIFDRANSTEVPEALSVTDYTESATAAIELNDENTQPDESSAMKASVEILSTVNVDEEITDAISTMAMSTETSSVRDEIESTTNVVGKLETTTEENSESKEIYTTDELAFKSEPSVTPISVLSTKYNLKPTTEVVDLTGHFHNLNSSEATEATSTPAVKVETTTMNIPSITISDKVSSTTIHVITNTSNTIAKIPNPIKKTSMSSATTSTLLPTTLITKFKSTTKSTTKLTDHLTTIRPKIEPVVIGTNPSILDADINYDYSEPTLPPSLPNLKIIPFLPTDAVKNIIHSNRRKVNYNYYQSNPNPYSSGVQNHQNNAAASASAANYSPFNTKPNDVVKNPNYSGNLADDRIDYDSYRPITEDKDNFDYTNVYAGSAVASDSSAVNSKLDYELYDQKVFINPSKLPVATTTNKNLLVKPPLPPFESEYEYDVYRLPPPTQQLQTSSSFNIYGANQFSNDPQYGSEHNYHVPDFEKFATVQPPRPNAFSDVDGDEVGRPVPVFNYMGKNKFTPPLKTEGGFVPKRTSNENYIPLHGSNYLVDSAKNEVGSKTIIDNSTESNSTKLSANEAIPLELDINHKLNIALNQSSADFEKYIISITTDANYNNTEEFSDAFLALDVVKTHPMLPEIQQPMNNEWINKSQVMNNTTSDTLNIKASEKHSSINETKEDGDFFSNLYGFIFKDEEKLSSSSTISPMIRTTAKPLPKNQQKNSTANPNQIQNNTIPLKLITILNNTKKDSPTKVEIPQRKNNKIIDPANEPLNEDTNAVLTTSELPSLAENHTENVENLTILRDVLLATFNRPSIGSGDISDELLHKSPQFLQPSINKLSSNSFIGSASFSGLSLANSVESKHNFQTNPIRSELGLIIPNQNKNKPTNDFGNANNFSPSNYQVLPNDDANISNTESYVINPVDLDKLKVKQQSHRGETKIYTPPLKDPAGILKLAGCNIYGRMYRVGRIISELSSPCLECRCTEVGVSCTPLSC